MYPITKYTFVEVPAKMDVFGDMIAGPQVIALSTYAGKTVRGVAKCHPADVEKYTVGEGMELAAARCAEKIAQKRLARATRKMKEAEEILAAAQRHYNDMQEYYASAHEELKVSQNVLAEFKPCGGKCENCTCDK